MQGRSLKISCLQIKMIKLITLRWLSSWTLRCKSMSKMEVTTNLLRMLLMRSRLTGLGWKLWIRGQGLFSSLSELRLMDLFHSTISGTYWIICSLIKILDIRLWALLLTTGKWNKYSHRRRCKFKRTESLLKLPKLMLLIWMKILSDLAKKRKKKRWVIQTWHLSKPKTKSLKTLGIFHNQNQRISLSRQTRSPKVVKVKM